MIVVQVGIHKKYLMQFTQTCNLQAVQIYFVMQAAAFIDGGMSVWKSYFTTRLRKGLLFFLSSK